MYNSINFLPPYLQQQPIFKDLCFFIDYLEVDIDSVYNDLRYKYIDWNKVSEEGAIQVLKGMGMDYIVDLINVITPSNSSQLLGLCSLLWLLKGSLLGVDVIADICGFTYETTVWHEQIPLGEPNTATLKIKFIKERKLTEDFQYNFVEFLRKYLYPITGVIVQTPTCEGKIYSLGYTICKEQSYYTEVQSTMINTLEGFKGTFNNTYEYGGTLKLKSNTEWRDEGNWDKDNYYSTEGTWTSFVNTGNYITSILEAPHLDNYSVTSILDYKDFGNQQVLIYWSYSEDNKTWSNWRLLKNTGNSTYFKYFQFKIVLNALENKQILVYSCRARLDR